MADDNREMIHPESDPPEDPRADDASAASDAGADFAGRWIAALRCARCGTNHTPRQDCPADQPFDESVPASTVASPLSSASPPARDTVTFPASARVHGTVTPRSRRRVVPFPAGAPMAAGARPTAVPRRPVSRRFVWPPSRAARRREHPLLMYTVDAVGNRTQMVDTTGTTAYTYDSLYRLTAVTYPNADTQSYTYDAMGNRLTKVHNGAPTSYTYDDANQMTSLDAVNNQFDKNGNLRSLGTDTLLADRFLYDHENRLFRLGRCRGDVDGDGNVSILDLSKMAARFGTSEGSAPFDQNFDLDFDGSISVLDNSVAASEFGRSCVSTGASTGEGRYTYNGDGARVRSRTFPQGQPAVTRDFSWDVASSLPSILQETRTPDTGTGGVVTYLYGAAGLIATTDSAAGTSYYLQDGLGSTTELTSTTGAVTDSYTYDVFGAPRTTIGTSASDFRFTGEQTDTGAQRGLVYLRARHYDPALGRFLSQDPLPFMQRYAYAGNNPATYADPTGLCVGPDWRCHAQDSISKCSSDLVGCGKSLVEAGGDALLNQVLCGSPGGALACAAIDALEGPLQRLACSFEGSDESKEGHYFDLNFAYAPATIGFQLSCKDGLRKYAGFYAGLPGVSLNIAPDQDISEGGTCSVQGSLFHTGTQFGFGGLPFGATGFVEAGVAIPWAGAGAGCYWVE